MDVKDDFSGRLAEAMKDAGITGPLRERAERMGISKSFMDALEKGTKLPAREKSLRFASLLGVCEAWLMEGTPPKRLEAFPKITIEHWSKADQDALLNVYRSIETKYNHNKER